MLDVINAFEKATGIKIPFKIVARRPGDTTAVYADPRLAEQDLNWKARLDLQRMCKDAHRWQSKNPRGLPVRARLRATFRGGRPQGASYM